MFSKRLALGGACSRLPGQLCRQCANGEMHHAHDLQADAPQQCRHDVRRIQVVANHRVIDKGARRDKQDQAREHQHREPPPGEAGVPVAADGDGESGDQRQETEKRPKAGENDEAQLAPGRGEVVRRQRFGYEILDGECNLSSG